MMLQVKARLNLHGIVSVESATQIVEEEYEEPVKVAKGEGAKAQAAADAAQSADAPMQVPAVPSCLAGLPGHSSSLCTLVPQGSLHAAMTAELSGCALCNQQSGACFPGWPACAAPCVAAACRQV